MAIDVRQRTRQQEDHLAEDIERLAEAGSSRVLNCEMWVRRTHYGALESDVVDEELDDVRVPVFHTEPARVRVAGSVTRSLPNGNYIKVEVGIELPALPVDTEVARAAELASIWVEDRIQLELTEAEENRGQIYGHDQQAQAAQPPQGIGPIQPENVGPIVQEGRALDVGVDGTEDGRS